MNCDSCGGAAAYAVSLIDSISASNLVLLCREHLSAGVSEIVDGGYAVEVRQVSG